MEPPNYQKKLLIISFFVLMLLNSVQALCKKKTSYINFVLNDTENGASSQPDQSVQYSAQDSSPSKAPTPTSKADSKSPSSHDSSPTPPPSESETSLGSSPQSPSSSSRTDKKKSDSNSDDDHDSSSTTPSPSNSNPVLQKICEKTDYPSLCLSSITPFFTGKVDVMSVLEMAIKATTQQTQIAMKAISSLASSPTSSKIANNLKDCKEIYDEALENLQKAMDNISNRDVGTIQTMLSAALTDYGTCDDEFNEHNPMGSYNEKLTNMAGNCLAIVELIEVQPFLHF